MATELIWHAAGSNRAGSIKLKPIVGIATDEIVAEATDLQTRWPEMDENEKRNIVEAITHGLPWQG